MLREHPNEDLTGITHHTALVTLNKYYKQFKPHKVILAFDTKPYWREIYTQSDECISKQIYKGDRNNNLTKKQKKQLVLFQTHIKEFERLIRKHTSIICMASRFLEADDLAAGFVQRVSDEHEIILVSGDKDYIQLLRTNVSLYEPGTGKKRTLDEWDNDVELFLFEKCIRGSEDNIMSAYPRVRKTRIRKAYTDHFERANLMNTTWSHPLTKQIFLVRDLFEENKLLMDLREQPEYVRTLIDNTITESINNPGTFSYFNFMRYLGKHELTRIIEGFDNYIHLLNS